MSWLVASSTLVLEPESELSKVALEVALVPIEPSWVSLQVLDGRVRLTNQSMPLHQGPDGSWWFTGYLSRPLTLKVQGTLSVGGDNGQVAALKMAQGARQEVRVHGRAGELPLLGQVDGRAQGVIAPRSSVSVSWSPERTDGAKHAKVTQAQVSTAAWLDEGALNLRSSVRWEVRRGSYERFRLGIPTGATELDVKGVGVARWERQGNELIIEPLEAVEGALELQVDWRQTFVKGQAQVAHPLPLDAGNTTYSLTLAGDAETLLSPSAQGMRAVAVEELPPKARAIGDAPANAAWTGPGTLSLKALKLNSLDGPDLVVDLARCTAAQSPEGRTLMTCSLDVRNASKQFLGIALPEGFSLWSVRVNGDGVSPVRMDDGRMNVPLERSVETLAGLTAIAVELTFLGDEQAWEKRGERAHQLPAFDAPVARLEWELRLPPGYKATAEGGSARTAGETTTELVYASVSEAREAEQAREIWNMALDAYQDNDFETAQAYVDQTLALDSDNYNAVSLQTNLDVLSGDAADASGADEAMSRRVKDMAKAKVADEEFKQKEKLAQAERLLNEGRYEEAIEGYEEVEEMSKELARYEHVESKKQSYYGSSSSSGAAEARSRADSRNTALTLGGNERGKLAELRGGRASDAEETYTEGTYTEETTYKSFGRATPSPEWEATELALAEEDVETDESGLEGLADTRSQAAEPDEFYSDGAMNGADIMFESGLMIMGGGAGSGAGPMEEPDLEYSLAEVQGMTSPEPLPAVPVEVDLLSSLSELATVSGATAQRPNPSSRSAQGFAPASAPPPGRAPKGSFATLDGKPAIQATTLAIPLPDHGQSVVVVQRLLDPGEAPTLTIRYRETR